MKHVLFMIAALLVLNSSAQTPQENLDKYWKYRDRLRKNFLKIGDLAGESIPLSSRSIGFAYSGAPANANGDLPSRIYYQDATIYLGHYLAVLATEAKLLLNSYDATTIEMEQQAILEQLNATMNELYYAIQTVNRLDRRAEEYLSQGQNTESPDDLNGLLLRDDVDEDFHENFLNDHSEIFQRECDFEKTHSDYKPLRVWGTDETGNTVTPGEQVNFNAGNYMSLDQITTIFTGLRCVFDLVDPAVVKSTVDEYILLRKLS
jgi:hypothetical protein